VLSIGDMAPDFMLPDQHKRVDPFQALLTGGPVVLHFFFGFAKRAHEQELAAFAEDWPALSRAGVELFAISSDGLAANIEGALRRDLPFSVLTDPGGAVHRQFGVPVIDPRRGGNLAESLVTLVLDPGQRVRGVFAGRRDSRHAVLARAVVEALAWDQPRVVTRTAPVLLIPEVIDRAYCRRLIDVWHTGNRESGTITMAKGQSTTAIRHEVKRRRDHHVSDPALFAEIRERVFHRIQPQIFRAFDRTVTQVEEFKIVRYDAGEGGFFRPHRDNTVPQMAHRRFAMTLNLNTDEHEGGELRFPEFGPDLYRPGPGDAVIFSCSLLHEALDVTRGSRFTLLSFLTDDHAARWRQARAGWFGGQQRQIEEGLARQKAGAG